MPNNIIHLPGNINASQILYEDNSNIKNKIDDIQTSITETNDAYNEELEKVETKINNKTTELNQKISNIINTSCIETQAITYSSTNPNTIYFSTDTNCVIINGEIYGRGQHLSNVFRLIPSDKTIGSTGYDNTNVIYIQPDGTNFILYYYSINNTWESIGNIAFDIAIDASDITYDLTATPDLGDGDVQSAIEALDSKVEKVAEDVVRTGYLIASWEDDKILTSTTYAVGSTIGEWGNGVRYGCRGVRLNVKKGDKILLDTYSPELFGLIFTDENRVVKALYDDRRFDGVWTAPVNGYCYIQDVLYRKNYHYASAHGHLAYMAHDARKRVTKDGDWYNEFSARIMQECMPIEVNKTGNTQTYIGDGGAYSGANYVSIKEGKFVLIATRIYTYADSVMAGTSLVTASWHNSSATAVQIMSGGSSAYISNGYNWGYRIYIVKQNYTGTVYQGYWNGSSTEKNHHRIDKAYMHSFDNFADAYHLAQKIINGEVEVDNFYGVRENEVDIVRNTIGLQSINDLGYNILDYGATLPIDEEGYKYAKEIYERYKDNPPTGNIRALFANDQKLVYFPNIDLSNATTIGGNTSASFFMNCYNLKVIPPLNLTGNLSCSYTIQGCRSLKRIESLGDVKVTNGAANFMYSCFALEYVGKIDTSECTSFWGLLGNAYSLKRIEELDLGKVSQWGSGTSVTWPGNAPVLEYMLLKNIFRLPSQTTHIFTGAPKWGINSEENPDARQSLVDSLLTYSYDRVNDPDGLGTADTTCTITLSVNTYNQLTTSEIDAITAKGYTLTHP